MNRPYIQDSNKRPDLSNFNPIHIHLKNLNVHKKAVQL